MEKNGIGMDTCVQVDISGTIEIPASFFTALGKNLTGDAVWAYYDEPSDPEMLEAWGGAILLKPVLAEYESFEIEQCAICPITKTEAANTSETDFCGKVEIPLRFWEKLGLEESRRVSLKLDTQHVEPKPRHMEIVIRPQDEKDTSLI